MRFTSPLHRGRLERRYKRFLADVTLDDGTAVTAHCPNTGSMMGCCSPGAPVWLSYAPSPKRKYAHTWEMVEVSPGTRVGIHTGRANALVGEGIEAGLLPTLTAYPDRRAEARVPDAPMRADWLLDGAEGEPPCFVEVKNVTAAVEGETAFFPDAVTERGRRHLDVLGDWVESGGRACLVYCVQREDVDRVCPAERIDPAYAAALRRAVLRGVAVEALGMRLDNEGISPVRRLPVTLD